MKRSDALVHIRIAGYHNDQKSFMRLYTENRVSLKAANGEFARGQNMKTSGVPCTCQTCKEGK